MNRGSPSLNPRKYPKSLQSAWELSCQRRDWLELEGERTSVRGTSHRGAGLLLAVCWMHKAISCLFSGPGGQTDLESPDAVALREAFHSCLQVLRQVNIPSQFRSRQFAA